MKFIYNSPTKPLEPGLHEATVCGAEETLSSRGDEQIILELRFRGGFKIKDRLTASEKAKWRVSQAYHALGFSAEEDESVTIEADEFIGRQCTVRLEKSKPRDDGKQYLEVVEYVASVPI